MSRLQIGMTQINASAGDFYLTAPISFIGTGFGY